MNLWRELFDARTPDSRGQRVQALIFELVVLYGVREDVLSWADQLASQPGILVPTGLGRYLDLSGLLSSTWAQANALLTLALMLLGLTRLIPGAYLGALLSYHLQFAARYSLGKIGHASNVLGFALLALGTAQLAYRDPVLRRRAAQGFMLILLSVGYTWAGICKLLATGLSWVDGHHLWLWIREKWVDHSSLFGKTGSNKLQRMLLSKHWLATSMLTVGLASELGSSLMVVRRARRWVLFALVAMHVGILYSMDIAFMNNIYVLLSMALPIAELVDGSERLLASTRES